MLVMSLGLLFPPVHCPPPFFLFWALFCSSVSPRTVPIVISHVFFPSFPFFAWQILIYIFSLAHHPVCLFSPRCHQPGAFSGPLSISYLPLLPFSPLSLNLSSFISLQDIWPSHILNLWSPNSHFRHEVMCVYVCSPRWKFVFVCLGHALY